MRFYAFSSRVFKEIVRDPLNVCFGLGFPIVLLLLMSAIQANIPVELFAIENLAPGITVFGLAFMSLFSATLIAKDKESALMLRIYSTPLKPSEYILGYTIPILPVAILQQIVCYGVSLLLGLDFGIEILIAIITGIPISLLFIVLGLMFGSILNVKQVGGICGALLTNLTAWLSGIWFDLNLVGGIFEKIARILPFYHAVELQKNIIALDFSQFFLHIIWIFGYILLISFVAIILFIRQMKKN